MKYIALVILVGLLISIWSKRAHARLLIRRRLIRIRRASACVDPFNEAVEIDALLWMHSIKPESCGIESLEWLYDSAEHAERRYHEQRMRTSKK